MLKINKEFRRYKPYEDFNKNSSQPYFLLPFRFQNLTKTKEVLVNDIGDFVIVPSGTAEMIITKKLKREDNDELYCDLVSNFIISEEKIPPLIDVIATRYRTKKSFLDNFTSLHIFVITLRCEHTCHYCQVSRVSQNRRVFDMDKIHIEKGIEMMMKSPNNNVTMEFQGGEALLAFDSIVYAIEKTKIEARIRDKNVTYVICTNLAPLTNEMLEYCKENNVLVSTSIDGPEFIHNQSRLRPEKNSYELAINGINKCRDILGYDKVSALLTTTSLTLNYPNEVVDEYYNLGFRSIFLRPISPFGFATNNSKKNKYKAEDFIVFYKKALHRIIEYNLNGTFYREDYATIILKKILTPFPVGYVDLQSPSGMINNVIVFNYDGKVYATDEARMLAEKRDFTFQVGDLNCDTYSDIFYGSKAIAFSDVWANEGIAGCSECAFQNYCGSDPVFNYATQGDMYGYRPASEFCKKNMEIIRYLFELIDSDKKIEKIFQNWVNQ